MAFVAVAEPVAAPAYAGARLGAVPATKVAVATHLDCADPVALSTFWSAFLGREPDPAQVPDIVTIGRDDGHPFDVFQKLDDLSTGLNRAHVDFSTPDLDSETERLLGLGATLVQKVEEHGIRFFTFADPEGNKFDVMAG